MLVNAATFLLSAIVLARLPIDATRCAAPASDGGGAVEPAADHGIRAGLRALRGVPGLAVVVAAGAATTLALSMMNVAEPLLARGELNTGGAGFAVLVCAFGIGSTAGALRGRADGWSLLAALAGGGVALVASALAPSVAVAAVTFLVTGAFAGAFMSGEHQMIARLSPQAVLGRAFGLKDALDAVALCAAFVGGALIASHTDARIVFAVSGAAALLVALVGTGMLLRAGVVAAPRRVRRIGAARSPRGGGYARIPVELGDTAA
jgi:hypothetical protein